MLAPCEEMIERGFWHSNGGQEVSASHPMLTDQLRDLQVQMTHSQLVPQGQFWHFMAFLLGTFSDV